MNRREAYALLAEMQDEDHNGECRQIGNGEWTVVVNWTFLWSKADWKKYKKGKLATLEAVKQKVEAKA